MSPADPFNLQRFLDAQGPVHAQALAEIRAGRKESHWMWFIFPQFAGLGFSSMAERYAITSLDEARAYLAHPTLGPRLIEVAAAALGVNSSSARAVFGTPDDLKLRSCATLFAAASPPGSVFERLLTKYYRGEKDEKTLGLLERRVSTPVLTKASITRKQLPPSSAADSVGFAATVSCCAMGLYLSGFRASGLMGAVGFLCAALACGVSWWGGVRFGVRIYWIYAAIGTALLTAWLWLAVNS